MHIHKMPSFFLIKMTEVPKGMVLGLIQPRLMCSHSYCRIPANSSSLIWYSWGIGGNLCLSTRSILCLLLLSTG